LKRYIHIDSKLLASISDILIKKQLTISIAESCTGGFLSTLFTSQSGSSTFFKGSMVTYSNYSKINLLDIDSSIINVHGVVSESVVEKMADEIRKKYKTNYGLATTGYVELSNITPHPKNFYLHAWISIASSTTIMSKSVTFNKTRLENISTVSYMLLSLLRKEIL